MTYRHLHVDIYETFTCVGAGDDNQIVLSELGLSTAAKTNPKATYVSLETTDIAPPVYSRHNNCIKLFTTF
jgi:hypothetical protein